MCHKRQHSAVKTSDAITLSHCANNDRPYLDPFAAICA